MKNPFCGCLASAFVAATLLACASDGEGRRPEQMLEETAPKEAPPDPGPVTADTPVTDTEDPSSSQPPAEESPPPPPVDKPEDAYKDGVCSRRPQSRGVGTPPADCAGADKDGLLCYPHCAAGYNGVGPLCWEECPAGYTDDGLFCRRDVHVIAKPSYGRGVGTIPWGGCGAKELDAGLCYTKCAAGFDGVGPVCWGTCPAGYEDDGATCRRPVHIFTKKSYGRDAGHVMHCAPGLEEDTGLCYPLCPAGYVGAGPICWKFGCPATVPVVCGWGCAKDQQSCTTAMANQLLTSKAPDNGIKVPFCAE